MNGFATIGVLLCNLSIMDPITTAIISAIANLSKDVIKDSYTTLKAALEKKFGKDSNLVDAVNGLEKKPESEGRKTTLQEEVDSSNANNDPELQQLAQSLLTQLQEQPGGQQIINQNISHVKYGAISATGNATISNITEHRTDPNS
ncbi:hypothetical protein VB711_11020 [Cronbergia sp. UHCC 0137]|uniref:hypothetical protein n=1 Tax=Cronbergia sp. UHCC 0137 TaxID=3110239 RepID=UPI002B1FAEC4|nr:hypothetical protein [Cronbergia sp. UHCC 0137]MEA5618364.1 hypothetical protein [Cronbergia sp. UHCC 0137]